MSYCELSSWVLCASFGHLNVLLSYFLFGERIGNLFSEDFQEYFWDKYLEFLTLIVYRLRQRCFLYSFWRWVGYCFLFISEYARVKFDSHSDAKKVFKFGKRYFKKYDIRVLMILCILWVVTSMKSNTNDDENHKMYPEF